MAIKYVDPKVAAWVVKRQDALLMAERLVQELAATLYQEWRALEGMRLTPKQKKLLAPNTLKSLKARIAKADATLRSTQPKRWDRSKV